MNPFKIAYSTFIEALFPLSSAEKELFSYTTEKAYEVLPPAPAFTGLAVPLPEASAVFAYKDKRVEQLVWNIKYKKSKAAVKTGGFSLYQSLNKFEADQPIIIIPMPITNRRKRERGFNQSELLVNEIRRLDTAGKFIYENDLLVRTHHASRQTLKGRADRVESAKGIFAVNEEVAEKFIGSTIIIIDDVITTGSTMKEALDTLKAAGFNNVRGLALAH